MHKDKVNAARIDIDRIDANGNRIPKAVDHAGILALERLRLLVKVVVVVPDIGNVYKSLDEHLLERHIQSGTINSRNNTLIGYSR